MEADDGANGMGELAARPVCGEVGGDDEEWHFNRRQQMCCLNR